MKSIFEEMGGTYRQEGDYLVPDLKLPDTEHYQIGKYGHLRQSYLREHRPVLYNTMLLNGTLNRHLAEVDQTCYERLDCLVKQMAEREGVTEALKASDHMAWVLWTAIGSSITFGDHRSPSEKSPICCAGKTVYR